jgi:hypothetical protein
MDVPQTVLDDLSSHAPTLNDQQITHDTPTIPEALNPRAVQVPCNTSTGTDTFRYDVEFANEW